MSYLAAALGLLCAISITILFGLIAMSGRQSRREEKELGK